MLSELGPMTLKELKYYIVQDMGYYNGKPFRSFLSRYLFEAGFKFIFWHRITRYFYLKNSFLYFFPRFILKHYSYKYNFDISYRAQIGPNLQIAHFGYIIVPSYVTLGKNCKLRPGVVFGKKLTGETEKAVIGDNCDFGVGSKIIGNVKIGDNVIVGANAVITKNVPSDVVVAGVPGKIIKIK